jgi:hypothetical protein
MDVAEQPAASTATPGDADEAAAASEPDQDHAGLAGVEARRRRAERDVMTALGRRLLEERERMGGLGVSIR